MLARVIYKPEWMKGHIGGWHNHELVFILGEFVCSDFGSSGYHVLTKDCTIREVWKECRAYYVEKV